MGTTHCGATAVITGASSGIGRAAALAFAREGANLVLAARRERLLREVAVGCKALGVSAVVVPTDVTDAEAVEELARRAVAESGSLEVWVNNAGVSALGRLDEVPLEAIRRVVDTNLLGYVHGARAAIPRFRERGSGVLVNNASVLGHTGGPYVAAYAMTKFAIRGLTESLRQELRALPDVHVCTVSPGSIDTPFFQHVANFTGRAPKALRPVVAPERVARAMVSLAKRPRRESIVGGSARTIALQRVLAPPLHERLFAKQIENDHFQDRPAGPTFGNLFEPMEEGAGETGGWKDLHAGRGRKTALAAAGVAVPALVAGAWLRR